MGGGGAGRMPQRTFISEEEKQALGFEAGRNSLTALYCRLAL